MNTKLPQATVDHVIANSSQLPRMSPQDANIWRDFLGILQPTYATIRYDLRLGEGRPAPPGTDQTFVRMWNALTQYRIDAVIIAPPTIFCVEVKPIATPGLIGQLLAYEDSVTGTPLDHPSVKFIGLCGYPHEHVARLGLDQELVIVDIQDKGALKIVFGDLVKVFL